MHFLPSSLYHTVFSRLDHDDSSFLAFVPPPFA